MESVTVVTQEEMARRILFREKFLACKLLVKKLSDPATVLDPKSMPVITDLSTNWAYWWNRSRAVRHVILAYGYIRGFDYKRMENSCAERNDPDARLIHSLLALFSVDPVTLEDVRNWVKR